MPDLPLCELAVLWRRSDRRAVVRVATDSCCRCAAAAHARGRAERHTSADASAF